MSAGLILMVLAVAFLIADALNKLPSWPWGICLLLILVVGK